MKTTMRINLRHGPMITDVDVTAQLGDLKVVAYWPETHRDRISGHRRVISESMYYYDEQEACEALESAAEGQRVDAMLATRDYDYFLYKYIGRWR